MLFVSHNMAAIQGLCHKTMVLESGRTVFSGETSKAIEQYTLSGEVASDAKISLKNHANRVPGCEPILEELEIRVKGELSTNVGMGESLEISVSFKSPQAVRGVGFAVEDSFGRRLFIVSPNYTNPDLLGFSTTCAKLICTLTNLPLLPGSYYLTINVAGFSGMLDKIEQASIITVSERDVFKTGVRLGKDKGLFFTYANWRLESAD